MITLLDKQKKFLEINSGPLSPEGKLDAIEKFLADADKQNEAELKELENQKEDAAKKAEKAKQDEIKKQEKAEADQVKADAQEKSDSSIKKVEVVGAELITIKGEKGDPGADSSVPGPIGPEGKPSKVPGPKGTKGEKGESIVGPPGKDGSDGKNAEPNQVVPLVMDQLKLPEVKDLVLDAEKIVSKINELPTDADEFKIDASHIKGLISKAGRAVSNVVAGGVNLLASLLDVSIVNPTARQVLRYNSTTNRWENSNPLIVKDNVGNTLNNITTIIFDVPPGGSAFSGGAGVAEVDLVGTQADTGGLVPYIGAVDHVILGDHSIDLNIGQNYKKNGEDLITISATPPADPYVGQLWIEIP